MLLLDSGVAFAQSSATSATSSSPSALAEVDTYVKVIGAALTGIATLIGLPIVFLTYRKTNAEITKLELESNALREKQGTQAPGRQDTEGNIQIFVDRSPDTNIQVLADPRFLAPLLILLDFIFAWVVLTLAGHLLSIFNIDVLMEAALTVLAGLVLLPIARQVLRVRAVLRPPRTPDEVRASERQPRIAVYALYAIFVVSTFLFGALLLNVLSPDVSDGTRYFAWGLVTLGVLLIAVIPLAKRRFDRYLAAIHSADSGNPARSE